MNDCIENWLADVSNNIETSLSPADYEYIADFVESVTDKVADQVKDNLLGPSQIWHKVSKNTKESGSLPSYRALFARSRMKQEINA